VQEGGHDDDAWQAALEVLVYQLRAAAARVRVCAPEVLELSPASLSLLSEYHDARTELDAALVQLVMTHGEEIR